MTNVLATSAAACLLEQQALRRLTSPGRELDHSTVDLVLPAHAGDLVVVLVELSAHGPQQVLYVAGVLVDGANRYQYRHSQAVPALGRRRANLLLLADALFSLFQTL